jgi:YHS domain-containing protein
MKSLLTFLAAAFIFTVASAAEPLNTLCPISGKPANPAITSNYTKTVIVCCDRCVSQFNANPKSYLSSILTAITGQCPMSKKKVDGSKKVTYARPVAFADAASKATFDAAPDKHIREVRQ